MDTAAHLLGPVGLLLVVFTSLIIAIVELVALVALASIMIIGFMRLVPIPRREGAEQAEDQPRDDTAYRARVMRRRFFFCAVAFAGFWALVTLGVIPL